ncbi:MAG: hypothetical protein IT383_09570 [Deltaproteobacteria bacterium]|nr:hypothetical protein [Deltaproteobacteria bacterium]
MAHRLLLPLASSFFVLACGPGLIDDRPDRPHDESVDDDDDSGEGDAGVLPDGCGDDVADLGEVCDGSDLRGGTCAESGFGGGTLACASDCRGLDFASCTDPLTPCAGEVCQNGGSCIVVDDDASCLCPEGFTGSVCEQASAPSVCETITCSNGGLCGLPGFEPSEPSCDCTPFFGGATCDIAVSDPRIDGNPIEFYYRWQAEDTAPAVEQLPDGVERPTVDLGGDAVVLPAGSAAQRLLNEHGIVLDDAETAWDDATATALLKTLERFPTPPRAPDGSFFRLTKSAGQLENDIDVAAAPASAPWVWPMRLAADAFSFANPIEQPPHDGVERVFYSNRLYRAVVRAFFRDGAALEGILQQRYGVTVRLGEPKDDFQLFSYEELIFMLATFEDYPAGFRNLANLEYLTRRKNGLVNPSYPQAPAIAWVGAHEIEFMDFAFSSAQADYIHRLVAHELSHFVYRLLEDIDVVTWESLSLWQEVAPDHWVPGTATNFVSDYAHDINPDEDFAESLSFYIYDPDWVRTIAPTKYEFIRGVVDGYEYVLILDDRVVFQVFNLYPDITFPGRVVRVTNTVARDEDGAHHAKLVLNIHQPPYESTIAYARLFAPDGENFRDVYFYPDEVDPSQLVADLVFGPHDPDGYWSCPNITIQEWGSNNTTHLAQNDFGWLLWFHNDVVDTEAPVPDLPHVTGSAQKIGDEYIITVTAPVEDQQMNDVTGFAELVHYESGQKISEYATWNESAGILTWVFVVRPYRAAGTWTFRTFSISDVSGNWGRYDLFPDVLEFVADTAHPDHTPPLLDQDALSASAEPTNPEAPNGETFVTITYRARDDIAGLGTVSFRLLKPSGDTLFDYHLHDNFYTPYFDGDATVFSDYSIEILLPVGSEPGTWALKELTLCDKAGNCRANELTELGIVAPVE